MRLVLVDTLATVIFFTIVATFSERVLAGMEWRQVLVTRAVMIPVMVLTARPYSAWRDMLFARLRPIRRMGRILLDVAAFLSFQVPVYVATLVVAGADRAEILTSVGSAIVFMIALSRPFGLFLDVVRKMSGVHPRVRAAKGNVAVEPVAKPRDPFHL
ncbi:MAG: L-alanine exporter AlaE [Rhodobacteraceae bacterium]|nr:L-alanine exporter AlaE [Paracoccaceae bacterium]